MNIKSLTIFCSSSNNLEPIYYEISKKITEIIAEHNFSIIYGGGQVGLMGIVAKNALKLGINVRGVIPEFLNTKEIITLKEEEVKIIYNNPKINDALAALPGFANIHPDLPVENVQGALHIMYELEQMLLKITGMSDATLQPSAGSQGEFAGLLVTGLNIYISL